MLMRGRCTGNAHTWTSTAIGAAGRIGESKWMNTYDNVELRSMRICRTMRRTSIPRTASWRRAPLLAPLMLLWHEEPALSDVPGVPVLLPGGVQLLGAHGPHSRDAPGGDPAVRSSPQGCAGSCRHQGAAGGADWGAELV